MTNKNINTFHNDGKYIAASQRNGSGVRNKTGVLSGFETEVLYLTKAANCYKYPQGYPV